MKEFPSIDVLLSKRKVFDKFVYTSAKKAVRELKKRRKDCSIKVDIDVPALLKDEPRALLYVSLISPNYQIRRYVEIARAIGLEPLVIEQIKDKFSSNNEWKHSLGKLRFFMGKGKDKRNRIERENIIDFNKANGKPISSLKTFWGQPLVDFHHEFFLKEFPQLSDTKHIFDASDWLKENGKTPREYYEAFLSLLIKHGIQFENFMLEEKEIEFTKEVFLPAFMNVYKKTGYKPLIVALEPTKTEGDEFWISYPYKDKELLYNKKHGH